MEGINLRDQQMVMRMEGLLKQALDSAALLELRIKNAASAATIIDQPPASIVNLIDNSDFDWSKDRALNNPTLGGDIDFEAFNWYRHLATDTLLVEDAAHALKFAGHSLYAANEGANADLPRWDKVNGWPEVGAVGATQYDFACPLPDNFVRPGRTRFYIQFELSRRTATALPDGLQVYSGFWDNTVGQEKYIEGGNFTLTAVRVGAAGAKSRSFKVIGTSDYGAQIESNVVTIADSVASLSTANYVRLTLKGASGFFQFDLYELVDGVCSRIGQILNSIDVSYNHYDIAPKVNVGAAFPTVTATKARAYAETTEIDCQNGVWVIHDMRVPVPSTYDLSLTTGRQWFRAGLTLPTTDARQVLFDKIGISLAPGEWAASSRRFANTLSSVSMSSSGQGGGGGSGDGDGGPRCFVLEGAEIDVMHGHKEVKQPFADLRIGVQVVSDGMRTNRLISKRSHFVSETLLVETANGLSRRFSLTHRLRRNAEDTKGTTVPNFAKGDTIVTRPDRRIEITTVTRVELIKEQVEVGSIALGPGHWFWANDFASHNVKALE